MLERARAVDLEILIQYLGDEIIVDLPESSGSYGGFLYKVGEEFICLEACRRYRWSIDDLREDARYLDDSYDFPDMTLARSQLKRIVLFRSLIEETGEQQNGK